MNDSLFDDGCTPPPSPTSDCDWGWEDRVAPVDDSAKTALGSAGEVSADVDRLLTELPDPSAQTFDGGLPGELAPFSGIYDDIVGTSDVINGVVANPDVPLTPGEVGHLQDVQDRAGYWGDRIGQIADIEERYDEIDRDIREQLEAEKRHKLEYETLHEIDDVLREINSWPNVSGGPTYPTFPSR
jgi:hypothetical protein